MKQNPVLMILGEVLNAYMLSWKTFYMCNTSNVYKLKIFCARDAQFGGAISLMHLAP